MMAAVALSVALKTGQLPVGAAVPIVVRKYDGQQRFVVETTALVATPGLLIARGAVGRAFRTAQGVRQLPTVTLEYFPADRPYNVLSYFDPQTGALERHFCNLLTAATWDGTRLAYIDLDLDLSVLPNDEAVVEDLLDFRAHQRQWDYPKALRREVLTGLRELRALAAAQVPPFTAVPLAAAEALALASGRWPLDTARE